MKSNKFSLDEQGNSHILRLIYALVKMDLIKIQEWSEVTHEFQQHLARANWERHLRELDRMKGIQEKPWTKDAKRYAKRNPSFR